MERISHAAGALRRGAKWQSRTVAVIATTLVVLGAMILAPSSGRFSIGAAHAVVTTGDCNSNGIPDSSESSWANRDDDGDGFCNGVDLCPYEARSVNDASACQMQAITVPAKPADLTAPHVVYSGANVTLKGIARYGGDQYMWDFGDGSTPMAWTGISNYYNLSARHVYSGSVGQTFTATLSVRASAHPTTVAQATYPIEIEQGLILTDPVQVDVRAAMAAEEGLWYLHTSLTRGQFPDSSLGFAQRYGYWNGSAQSMQITCVGADAFETHGSIPSGNYDADPYVEDAQRALAYTLYTTTVMNVGSQSYQDGTQINADVNGNGIGISLGTTDDVGGSATCLTALADSHSPDRIAPDGPGHVVGRSFADLAQDAVDYFAYAQNDSGFSEGGWGYHANDNQFLDPGLEYLPYQALATARAQLAATVPDGVLHELPRWLSVLHHTANDTYNGGWGYNSSSVSSFLGVGTTSSGLIGEDLLGAGSGTGDFAAGVGFIYRHWNDNDGAFAVNVGNSVAMYATALALRAATPSLNAVSDYNYGQYAGQPIGSTPDHSLDWYYTPTPAARVGYAGNLVVRERSDGSWVDTTGYWTNDITSTTALDVMILSNAAPGMTADHAPSWQSPTPDAGTVISASPGEHVTIRVAATDPDSGDIVTLTATGAPSEAAFSSSPANAATGTLTWTPVEVGSTTITFTAADSHGVTTTRSVVVSVAKKTPTVVWPTPAPVTYGTTVDATQLDAALSSAAGAEVPPHTGTFTYTPTAGTVLDAGDDALSVTWTPDPADAASWNAVTATVTLHVNQASQTLSFVPALDGSTTHTYGDLPFSVTAVSDAGLPVTYSVGAADACTSTPRSDGSTQLSITGAGSCTLSVTQAGDANYAPAAILTHSFTLAKQTPTVTLNPQDTTYGLPLGAAQLDAAVQPADAAGKGSIAYTIDGQPLPANGIVGAGPHTLSAAYTPDPQTGSDYTSASVAAPFEVAQAAQSIDFAQPDDRTLGAAAFPVTATATSQLPVSFASLTADVCSVTPAGTVSLLHAGTCTIAAEQEGDANHLPATPVSRSVTVHKTDQQITFAGPGDQTYLSAPVALVAAGGASGNAVTFTAAPQTVCMVDGVELELVGAGQCTVTASQLGDADYLDATDVVRTITVHQATPLITWATPEPISYGTVLGSAQLDAAVSPAIDGTFTYTLADGTTTAGGAALHASSTPQRLLVRFTPSAEYATDFATAAGATSIVVNKADQSITWTQLPQSESYGDAPFPVAATGGGSQNPVTFTTEAGSDCAITSNVVTITAAGPCVLDAHQDGNGDFNAAPTSTRSVTIDKATPTLTWAAPADISYGRALDSAQLDATVAPSDAAANGTITYTTDAETGPATGQVLHAGSHMLTATYQPSGVGPGSNYTSVTATVRLTVAQATQSVSFDAIATKTFGDGPLTLTATRGASGNPVYFTATGNCSVSGLNGGTLSLTGAGSCTVTAHEAGSSDYAPAPNVVRAFSILQAGQNITFAALADAYVGDAPIALAATGGNSGNPVTFTAGPAATCSMSGSGSLTLSGPGTCTVTASQAGNANFLDATPVSHSFAVGYRICTISDPNQTYKGGAVVQVRVTLCDGAGNSAARSSIALHAVSLDGGPVHSPGNSQPGNDFRCTGAGGGSYQYNLDTTGLPAGTHRLVFTVLGDPVAHSVAIVLR